MLLGKDAQYLWRSIRMENEYSLLWLLVINSVAWFFIHMGIALSMIRIPDEWLAQKEEVFRPRTWEKEGEFWQKNFRIRSWKKFLPDGSLFIPASYDQTNLHGTKEENLEKFILETIRAELTHWLMIPPAFLFFLWNPPWAAYIMILYALLLNLPLIMTQRYNRPRLQRLLEIKTRRKTKNE